MPVNSFFRVLATLVLALAAAVGCVALHTPLPWMIGPLLATSVVSIAGGPTQSWGPLRNAGQWTIGAALGLYFTPQVAALISGLWWAIVLGIVWALFLGWLVGAWLYRLHAPRMHGVPAPMLRATVRAVDWPGLALMALMTGAGALVMDRLGRANPWFMGAMLVSMMLTMAGISLSAVPAAMVNAAQLVIGVSLGVRFRADFLRTAPRWLVSVAAGTLVLMGACTLFAGLLAWATGLPWVTLLLGTSPGGITEMAITAKVLQLGVPVVTAFQVCRLMAVLMLVGPLYRRIYPAAAI